MATTTKTPLTARQRQILAWIVGYVAEHGHYPTYREIGTAHGIRSPNGVCVNLKALAARGLVKLNGGGAHSFTVVGLHERICEAARRFAYFAGMEIP